MVVERQTGERVFLRIGQSQFGTDIWVNGSHAGRYIGCYTSHEYDITEFLHVSAEENELIIRVGRKEDLPKESAVGNDHEKEIYTPGIWGDVSLEICRTPRITSVQVIPDIHAGAFRASVVIQNLSNDEQSGTVDCELFEKKSREHASVRMQKPFTLPGSASATLSVDLKIRTPQLWSPDSPFLYELTTTVKADSAVADEVLTTCGLREFRIDGRRFLLNGKKIFLRGGNIAFHRFLADQEKGVLPWDPAWIRRVLVEIPKKHNFNFFRNHLGQLYPAWYDIADEGGMLLQNEWHFWGVTGTEGQITAEFSQWLRDNWNHPSIVLWDALNECSDDVVQKNVVPKMKELDPTRPWESVDFIEDHPYIYSLGPVLNKDRLGFTRGISELEQSAVPVVVNEFLWCWVNKAGEPTRLMDGVTERWLGPGANGHDLIAHQCFLATELVELFRRMRADAIQPFVYLSNNEGPTAHWFQGAIAELNPKPILKALKDAFSPVAVSIELWDRHFIPAERRKVRVFVLNDEDIPVSGTLVFGIADLSGKWAAHESAQVTVEPGGSTILNLEFRMPAEPGQYFAQAEIRSSRGTAVSRKIAHVVPGPILPEDLRHSKIGVFDKQDENAEFLRSLGMSPEQDQWQSIDRSGVLLIGEGLARGQEYRSRKAEIEAFLEGGGAVVILEPEHGLEGEDVVEAGPARIRLKKREDLDKGGYDSYVFPTDPAHPVFANLIPEHFRMFNGGFGGEMVSQHNMDIEGPHAVLARCGLHLRVCALAELVAGKGRVLVSRIQTRGRLLNSGRPGLYERRADPVARQYMMNLLSYAASRHGD